MQKILLSPDPVELAVKIRQWAGELGFGQVGFSRPDLGEHGRHLQHWLARGFHGDMTYMTAHGEKRWQPASLVEGTRPACLRMARTSSSVRRVRWAI